MKSAETHPKMPETIFTAYSRGQMPRDYLRGRILFFCNDKRCFEIICGAEYYFLDMSTDEGSCRLRHVRRVRSLREGGVSQHRPVPIWALVILLNGYKTNRNTKQILFDPHRLNIGSNQRIRCTTPLAAPELPETRGHKPSELAPDPAIKALDWAHSPVRPPAPSFDGLSAVIHGLRLYSFIHLNNHYTSYCSPWRLQIQAATHPLIFRRAQTIVRMLQNPSLKASPEPLFTMKHNRPQHRRG